MKRLLAKAHEIGFNTQVERESRSFHVQTEVYGEAELIVRTMVIEEGRVHHVQKRSYPPDEDLVQFQEQVDVQHQLCVSRVQRGDLG